MLIFKQRQISNLESTINNIYISLMDLDKLISIHGDKFDETPMVSQLTEQLNVLWENYWELVKHADKINIKYLGLSSSLCLNEALEHLIFTWYSVIIDRLNIHNLSENWINFAVKRELWNNRKNF